MCSLATVGLVTADTDPRWGEIDRHLFNEGRHWTLWRHLGAHLDRVDGVDGTQFAVWAPAASHVAVVGDFNNFDVGADPMTPIASTGVWSDETSP